MSVVIHFYAKNRAGWRHWLEKNHKTETSVWLVFDKGKNRELSWEDIVQEALCFGWIDSKPGKVSDTQSKIYISKRNPKSAWSKINKAHVEKMQKTGLMTSAGQQIIDEAKKNGAWDALNNSDNLLMPLEMSELFAKHPVAKKNYLSFSPSSQRIILEWIYAAKKDETKQKRIQQTVELAEKNLKANHYRQ
jgi:uncharacterized protein YdeI (YjbR/CyaY-like superfamily)